MRTFVFALLLMIGHATRNPASAQMVSWTKQVVGVGYPNWDPKYRHGLATADNVGVTCLIPNTESHLRTLDWQGVVVEDVVIPNAHSLRQLENGSMIVGALQGTTDLLGTTLQGGTADHDAYLARLDQNGDLVWVTNSVSNSASSLIISRFAASPNGRSAIISSSGGTHTWGSDTVVVLSGERVLLVFDEFGTLAWTKRFSRLGLSSPLFESTIELAINDNGDVWMAAVLRDDMACGADTILPLNQYSLDYLIAKFSPEGQLTAHMIIPGFDGGSGIGVRSIVAWPDGRAFLGGFYSSGTNIGDTTLLTSGPNQGLFMVLDPNMNIQDLQTLRSGGIAAFTAITADPMNNKIILAGNCGTDPEFDGLTSTLFEEITSFVLEFDVTTGLISWTPVLFTTDVLGNSLWPLDVVSRNEIVHLSGHSSGSIHRMDGTTISPGGFVARLIPSERVSVTDASMKSAPNLSIWPNPTSDILNVKYTGDGTVESYSIQGSDGRILESGNWTARSGSATGMRLRAGHLSAGTYVLHLRTKGQATTSRFVVY